MVVSAVAFSPEVAERTIHAGCPDQAFLLRCPDPRPNVDVVDREADDALARSLLAELPTELAGRLLAEGERADYPAGTTVPASPPSALCGHRKRMASGTGTA